MNSPSPPKITFFDDPDVLFSSSGPPAHPGPPPGWLPAASLAGGGERVGTGNTSCERLPLRPSPPESQLIPIPMSDGDDDQPVQIA